MTTALRIATDLTLKVSEPQRRVLDALIRIYPQSIVPSRTTWERFVPSVSSTTPSAAASPLDPCCSSKARSGNS